MSYQIPELTKYDKLLHAFSTKEDGNMSFKWGEEKEVRQNRQKFLTQLNINSARVVSAELEHSDKIIAVTNNDTGTGVLNNDYELKADGLITNQLGIFLWHVVADCLSIMFYDSINQAIGLTHAGRKSVSLGVGVKTIEKMTKLYNTKHNELIIGIGPSIHSCCYAFEQVEQASDQAWQNLLTVKNKLTYVDLAGFTVKQLLDAGVESDHIYVSPECTAHSDQFFSHYRTQKQGQPEARFAAIIGLRV